MHVSADRLALEIHNKLSVIQNHLIDANRAGFHDDGIIEPRLKITYDNLRGYAGRERLRQAFVDDFVQALVDEGLKVEDTGTVIKVKKSAVPVKRTYDSLHELDDIVAQLNLTH